MSEFKVGDKVRVVNTRLFNNSSMGRTGTITDINGSFFYVDFGDNREYEEFNYDDYGYEEDLELIGREFSPVGQVQQQNVKQKLEQIEALVAEVKAILG